LDRRPYYFALFALSILTMSSLYLSWSLSTGMGELTVEGFEIEGDQGRPVHFKVYQLRYVDYPGPMPVVLTIHGISESKESMYPYNLELARRNFTVISVDLSGHGDSQSTFNVHDINGMANDCYSALRFVQNNSSGVDNERYGVLGNSFGFQIAQALSQFAVTPSAYVAVGDFDKTGLYIENATFGNLLISLTESDEVLALEAFQRITDNNDSQIGITYGSFENQTAFRLDIAKSDNAFEALDPIIVASTTSWLVKAIQGELQYNYTIPPKSQIYFYKATADTTLIISIVGATITFLLLIHSVLQPNFRRNIR